MNDSSRLIAVVVAMVVLAGAFWLILLAPKRERAGELSEQARALTKEVASARQQVASARAAKRDFATDYRRLLELGVAVPAEAATPSLLVQLNELGNRARTSFQSISLGGGESASSAESTTGGAEELLPLGAGTGPAGLAAMPYALTFEGGFFDIAKFIDSLDSLVRTKGEDEVDADGRLVTIDGFSLVPVEGDESSEASGRLAASFTVNTYVTLPGQGLTAGATPSGPAETIATQP